MGGGGRVKNDHRSDILFCMAPYWYHASCATWAMNYRCNSCATLSIYSFSIHISILCFYKVTDSIQFSAFSYSKKSIVFTFHFSVREIHNLLPSPNRKIMKYYNEFPTESGVGRMFVGNVSDDVKFHPHDVITWQNVVGKTGVLQWMGWEDEMFAGMNECIC